jgi:hypothetical protein
MDTSERHLFMLKQGGHQNSCSTGTSSRLKNYGYVNNKPKLLSFSFHIIYSHFNTMFILF